jgi:hypothetical protein
MTVSHMDS